MPVNGDKTDTLKKNRVLLLDGYSLAYRAFFALPETLGTSSGQVTNAVFGFTSMLIKLEAEERPDAVIACMDKGAPQFRLDQYPAYKAGRSETPQTLRQQFPLIREVLEALCLPVVELEGYEADDVLGALSFQASETGIYTRIVTCDLDLLQLVSPVIGVEVFSQYWPTRIFDVQATRFRFDGLDPAQLPDYKALVGDSSDNLPGVRGIGARTASSLLSKYGHLEEIYDDLENIPSMKLRGSKRVQQLLRENYEEAFKMRTLTTIVCDGEISARCDLGDLL